MGMQPWEIKEIYEHEKDEEIARLKAEREVVQMEYDDLLVEYKDLMAELEAEKFLRWNDTQFIHQLEAELAKYKWMVERAIQENYEAGPLREALADLETRWAAREE